MVSRVNRYNKISEEYQDGLVFSLSNHELARRVRELEYLVLLAVDENTHFLTHELEEQFREYASEIMYSVGRVEEDA